MSKEGHHWNVIMMGSKNKSVLSRGVHIPEYVQEMYEKYGADCVNEKKVNDKEWRMRQEQKATKACDVDTDKVTDRTKTTHMHSSSRIPPPSYVETPQYVLQPLIIQLIDPQGAVINGVSRLGRSKGVNNNTFQCWRCRGLGHIARNCKVNRSPQLKDQVPCMHQSNFVASQATTVTYDSPNNDGSGSTETQYPQQHFQSAPHIVSLLQQPLTFIKPHVTVQRTQTRGQRGERGRNAGRGRRGSSRARGMRGSEMRDVNTSSNNKSYNCWTCGELGHMSRNCWHSPAKGH